MIAPSLPYSGSVWVRLEAWRRVDGERGLGGRASVQITINSKPFHRYPHEWALQYDVCGVERSEGPFTPLAEDRVRAVVKYVAGIFGFAINPISSVLLLFASGVGFIYRGSSPPTT